MHSITDVIKHFKQNWTEELSEGAIAQACREAGMTWRETTLNPVITLQIFFAQILHGNTAIEHLSHLTSLSFTASAYCQARMRVPLEVLCALLQRCVGKLQEETFETARWLGHRVFHIDGFSALTTKMKSDKVLVFRCLIHRNYKLISDSQERRKQAVPAYDNWPVAHWLVMMHAGTGMITKMLAAPLRTHDMSKTVEIHPELQAGDLLVADRGFCSYVHLALLLLREVHGLLRIHQRTIVDFTPGRPHGVPGRGKASQKKGLPRSRWIKQLGVTDQIVEWLKPTNKPSWISAEQFAVLPTSITVREMRYEIHEKGFRPKQITLVTTLLDSERTTSSDLAEQFRQRWEVETNFGHLKTTMKMDDSSARRSMVYCENCKSLSD